MPETKEPIWKRDPEIPNHETKVKTSNWLPNKPQNRSQTEIQNGGLDDRSHIQLQNDRLDFVSSSVDYGQILWTVQKRTAVIRTTFDRSD